MAKDNLNWMHLAVHSPVTLVFAVIIALVLNTALSTLTGMSAVFGTAITIFAAAGLLAYALKVHPGKEDFVTDIVVVLVVLGFSALLTPFIPALSFTIQLTSIAALALGLATIYFARAISMKLLDMAGVKM